MLPGLTESTVAKRFRKLQRDRLYSYGPREVIPIPNFIKDEIDKQSLKDREKEVSNKPTVDNTTVRPNSNTAGTGEIVKSLGQGNITKCIYFHAVLFLSSSRREMCDNDTCTL